MSRAYLGLLLSLVAGCHLVFPFDPQVEAELDRGVADGLVGADLRLDSASDLRLDLAQLADAPVLDSAKAPDLEVPDDLTGDQLGLCGPASCKGCCAGGICFKGDTPTACGLNGAACKKCMTAESCVGGACMAVDAGAAIDAGHPCSNTSSWMEDYNLLVSCTYQCGGATLQCTNSTNTCSCSGQNWSKSNCQDPGGSYQAGVPCITALDNGCCKPP